MKFRDNARAWALSYEATLTTLDCARFYLIECILCEMLNDVLFLDGCAYKKMQFSIPNHRFITVLSDIFNSDGRFLTTRGTFDSVRS